MAIRYTLNAFFAHFLLALVLILPAHALGADAVEKAFNLAKELADKAAPENQALQDSQPQAEADSSASGQAAYPGVENMHIARGGNGVPEISIYYPAIGNPAIDANLKRFAEEMADGFEKEGREVMEEDAEKPDSYGAWEETGFFTLERPNPDVVSITFNLYTYTGGAHGQILVVVQNYDLKNGARIEFKDLFANPDKALAILSEISAAKLRASLGDDVEEEMLASGTAPEESNFANLSLQPGGLAVEFQPYQVGPWSIGQQRVEISLAELAPAGPSSLVWPEKQDFPQNSN